MCRVLIPLPTKSHHLRSLEYVVAYGDQEKQSLMSMQLIHENFRLLRVLLLNYVKVSGGSLPSGIGNLIHLRYLGLWQTNIRELPSSIGNLRNLLTLEHGFADSSEVRIPGVLWKMESLRQVDFTWCFFVEETLHKIHTLKWLETLKGVRGGSWMLKELPLLTTTLQKLTIAGIESQEQLEVVFHCPSIREDTLHSLELRWQAGKLENLEPIIHSKNLRKLWLEGRMGDGLGLRFPTSIKKLELTLTKLEAEATLVALGKLPQLTILELKYTAHTSTRWTCTAGDFPQLQDLWLLGLWNLEEWSIERGAMPRLSKLKIGSCPKLRKLPDGLKFINTLQEFHVYSMPEEFMRRVKRGGEDAHIIQHVPLQKIDVSTLITHEWVDSCRFKLHLAN